MENRRRLHSMRHHPAADARGDRGGRRRRWRVGDPAGADLDEVRHARDDIERRVEAPADELLVAAASG
jgi:hypothetical protein